MSESEFAGISIRGSTRHHSLREETHMSCRIFTVGIALAAGLTTNWAFAQDSIKIGVVLPLTGDLAPVGKQLQAGINLYTKRNGLTAAGKKVGIIVRDDGSAPENSKRLAQELIVNDKVA